MKKTLLLSLLLMFGWGISAQQNSIIENILEKSVEDKITSMQELIGFNDLQANQLRDMELDFLREVNNAEHCFLCNTQKRIEKLKQQRDAQLQKILERAQYIQYNAIENKKIEKQPLWVN